MRISAKVEGYLLTELKEIFKPLTELSGVMVFVHGSWADNTRTAFSDLDDFIIINQNLPKEELAIIQSRLDEVEMTMQKIDPLQHHGHWMVTQHDLKDYDNSFFPLFILSNSLAISEENTFEANINLGKANRGTIRRIKTTCHNIEALFQQFQGNKLNLYQLKGFIGSIALLPPLLFQINGYDLDKRDAITRASELFSEKSIRLIQWASDLRNNWHQLLNHEEFKSFSQELENYSSAKEWRSYSATNSPILDYTNLSTVEITKDLVQGFVSEALSLLDKASFKIKSIEDYKEGYQKIENIALENGALIVGQFGNVKWPSISDLDVLICLPEQLYKSSMAKILKAIQLDVNLNYLFTHPPLFITDSMLPYVKYLHTLYDLQITQSLIPNFNIDKNVQSDYRVFYEDIWTFFLIIRIHNTLKNIKYQSSRALILLLKNIHTSIYNIERRRGKPSKALEESNIIRSKFLDKGVEARKSVEEAFLAAAKSFFSELSELSRNLKPKKDCFIVGRQYIFIAADKSSIERKGDKNYYYLNTYLFNLLYDLLIVKKSNETVVHQLALESVDSILKKLKAESDDPFLPFLPKYMLIPPKTLKVQVKGYIYSFLNSLPSKIINRTFKML